MSQVTESLPLYEDVDQVRMVFHVRYTNEAKELWVGVELPPVARSDGRSCPGETAYYKVSDASVAAFAAGDAALLKALLKKVYVQSRLDRTGE